MSTQELSEKLQHPVSEYSARSWRHAFAWVFYGVYSSIVWQLAPFVISKQNGTAFEALAVNVARAVPVLLEVFWMPFAERRNPVRLTGLFMMMGGAALLFSGMPHSTAGIALVLFIAGVVGNASQPTLGVSLQQVYPQPLRGKLMSLPNIASMLAQIVCLFAVGRTLRSTPEAYVWAFPAGGAALLLAGLIFRGVRGGQSVRKSIDGSRLRMLLDTFVATFRNRRLFTFQIGYLIATCGSVLVANIGPLFADRTLHLSADQYAYTRAGFMVAALLSFNVWGRFMDRFGAPATMVVTWILQGATIALVYFADSFASYALLFTVRGFFQSGNIIAFFPIVMHYTDSSQMGRGMSLHYLFWGARWLSMPLLAATIVERGMLRDLHDVFLMGGAAILLGLVVMAYVWLTDRRNEAGE